MQMRPRMWIEQILTSALVAAAISASPAGAQQRQPVQPPEESSAPAGDAGAGAAPADSGEHQFKFNLAPAKSAPGASAEVLLTAKPEGGYSAELTASALPDPGSLKTGFTTYVVWLYDPASKKKERVADLVPQAGSGTSSFDVSWGQFALVVTGEPSAEPKEWSGVAVLTGQPQLPASSVGAAPAASAQEPAEGAVGAGQTASGAEPADAGSAADSGETAGVGAPAGETAPPSAATAGGAVETSSAPPTGAQPSGAASATSPGPAGTPSAAADSGAEAGVSVSAEPPAGAAPAVEASGADSTAPCPPSEEQGKKKKRFSNPTLDAMADAAKRGESPCTATPEEKP